MDRWTKLWNCKDVSKGLRVSLEFVAYKLCVSFYWFVS